MNKLSVRVYALAALVLGLLASSAHAEAIRLTKAVSKAAEIAVVPFAGSNSISQIITQDLMLSGRLSVDQNLPERPNTTQSVNLPVWKSQGVGYVSVGQVQGNEVRFGLVNVATGEVLLNELMTVPAGRMNQAAHLIADKILEAITGSKSDFSGQLMFVSKTKVGGKSVFSLQIAATDGSDAQIILESYQPIRSPTWSPNGREIAYVSYESGRPFIYLQNLQSGSRQPLVQLGGTNGAPNFSPDGSKLLFSSSVSGDFEIYEISLGSKQMRRLTYSRGADTEPSYAPDGRSFVYTSDRSGTPQIYHQAFGGQAKRITLSGSYNTRPVFSSDGSKIALIHNYRAAIMDLASGAISLRGNSAYDESPSFSPSGDVLVYATKGGGKDIITMISANGKTRMNLPGGSADVRDPAWSPVR